MLFNLFFVTYFSRAAAVVSKVVHTSTHRGEEKGTILWHFHVILSYLYDIFMLFARQIMLFSCYFYGILFHVMLCYKHVILCHNHVVILILI